MPRCTTMMQSLEIRAAKRKKYDNFCFRMLLYFDIFMLVCLFELINYLFIYLLHLPRQDKSCQVKLSEVKSSHVKAGQFNSSQEYTCQVKSNQDKVID